MSSIKIDEDKKPQIGDILLYRGGKNFFTRMIRIFTTSDYNHASIYVGDGYVAEALAKGIVVRHYGSLDPYFDSGVDLYRPRTKLSQKQINELLENVKETVGFKYGYGTILKIALKIITGWKIKKKNDFRFICSEFVAWMYFDIGKDLFPELSDMEYVTPADLSNNKKLRKVW